jgi:hypothetical protein
MSSSKEQPMNPRTWTLEKLIKRTELQYRQVKDHQRVAAAVRERADSSITSLEYYMYNHEANQHARHADILLERAKEYEEETNRRRRTTILQALHPRLGENSPIGVLTPDVMARICEML